MSQGCRVSSLPAGTWSLSRPPRRIPSCGPEPLKREARTPAGETHAGPEWRAHAPTGTARPAQRPPTQQCNPVPMAREAGHCRARVLARRSDRCCLHAEGVHERVLVPVEKHLSSSPAAAGSPWTHPVLWEPTRSRPSGPGPTGAVHQQQSRSPPPVTLRQGRAISVAKTRAPTGCECEQGTRLRAWEPTATQNQPQAKL